MTIDVAILVLCGLSAVVCAVQLCRAIRRELLWRDLTENRPFFGLEERDDNE